MGFRPCWSKTEKAKTAVSAAFVFRNKSREGICESQSEVCDWGRRNHYCPFLHGVGRGSTEQDVLPHDFRDPDSDRRRLASAPTGGRRCQGGLDTPLLRPGRFCSDRAGEGTSSKLCGNGPLARYI